MINNELRHFGIKGMKWGRRKTAYQDDQLPKKKLSRDYKRGQTKSVKEMSDKELREAINRKALERQLQRDRKSVGARVAGDIIETVARQSLTSLGTKYTSAGIEKLIKIGVIKVQQRNKD